MLWSTVALGVFFVAVILGSLLIQTVLYFVLRMLGIDVDPYDDDHPSATSPHPR